MTQDPVPDSKLGAPGRASSMDRASPVDGVRPGGEIVIVTGPPGSGKSTVCAELVVSFERGVHLESDSFFTWIRSGFIRPHLPESHAQNTAVIDIVADAAAGYAEAGYVVLWDGIVGPWFLGSVSDRLLERGVRVRYLVVRSARDVALDRVRERDGTIETSGAATMWDQFADLGALEHHVVDSDGPVADVVARCRAALEGDALVLSPHP
jgi:adenylate kinase family enzyme